MEKMFEAAVSLGRLIKESDAYKKLDEAKDAYDSSRELAEYLAEYEADQKAIEDLATKEEPDTHAIDALQERLSELFKLVTEHPQYLALMEAQEAVNKLMEQINGLITFTITGKTPCTHDCSSCHADCHHE